MKRLALTGNVHEYEHGPTFLLSQINPPQGTFMDFNALLLHSQGELTENQRPSLDAQMHP